ncbi:MAG: heme oxygenase (biliverdin-producing) [Cyanobacteria bacterium P01_D01_bin.73]
MSSNLATKLREGTQEVHTMAENMGFIKCFLKGVVEKKSYRKLVGNFYHIYSAMEEEMDRHKDHPVVSKIYFPELHRKESLEKDMEYYFGTDWEENFKPSKAAVAYVDRIREVGNDNPELLASHSYTRYIGDLSGGQILKKITVNAMGLDEGEGTAFYEFDAIDDEKGFKDGYRASLNDAPVDDATADAIVEEAKDAFHMNMELFQELEGNLVKAIGKMLFNSLTRRRARGSTEVAIAE